MSKFILMGHISRIWHEKNNNFYSLLAMLLSPHRTERAAGVCNVVTFNDLDLKSVSFIHFFIIIVERSMSLKT